MSCITEWPIVTAGKAFDGIAESYDDIFTRSVIGRAQRGIVWDVLADHFRAGDRLLELNCGTGEDALFLARRGVTVEACDGSARMMEVAWRRKALEGPRLPIQFRQVAIEDLRDFRPPHSFDGVVSNFSGLNCVQDLGQVASELSILVRRGGKLALCLCNRVCLWELAWFGARGEISKAARRLGGRAIIRFGSNAICVWYPTLREIKRAFSPWFELLSARAVGLFVPPSYLEFWAREHAGIISRLARLDSTIGNWPVLRGLGDHILLIFGKVD